MRTRIVLDVFSCIITQIRAETCNCLRTMSSPKNGRTWTEADVQRARIRLFGKRNDAATAAAAITTTASKATPTTNAGNSHSVPRTRRSLDAIVETDAE